MLIVCSFKKNIKRCLFVYSSGATGYATNLAIKNNGNIGMGFLTILTISYVPATNTWLSISVHMFNNNAQIIIGTLLSPHPLL
jgi:hypothetical protein